MFKRRTPLTKTQNAKEMLWPTMGWWRLLKFYRARIIRLSSSTHSIAANLAGGAAMSFTPFFGIHVFAAMGFAWAIGAGHNIVAAMVGTFVGNPWTFPFLFYASYKVGAFIMSSIGIKSEDHSHVLNPDIVSKNTDGMWQFLSDNFHDIFIPTAIGGTTLAIISWPIYYYIFYYLVRSAQNARKNRLRKKQLRDFEKSAGEPVKNNEDDTTGIKS